MPGVRSLLVYLMELVFVLPQSTTTQVKATPPDTPCSGVAQCNSLGTESLKRGDIDTAISFFKAQVGFAEDAQNKAESVTAYNNLAVAYLHERDYFRALSWTRLALRVNPQNKAAKFNLQRIESNTKNHKWSTDVTGLYVRYSGRAQWDSVRVSQSKGSAISFHLLAYRIGLAWRQYGPGSYGDIDGQAVLTEGREAVYKDPDFESCRIMFRFKEDTLSVKQEGDCGFGYGVDATGDYERICSGQSQQCSEKGLP
jgi:tetratricopeptide (TPR) repeat protein